MEEHFEAWDKDSQAVRVERRSLLVAFGSVEGNNLELSNAAPG